MNFQNLDHRDYFVSSLIISELIRSQESPDPATIPLKHILTTFHTRLVIFRVGEGFLLIGLDSMGKILKALDSFVNALVLEEAIRNQLFLLYRDEIIFLMFFEKYESLVGDLMITDDSFIFGWLLFVHMKSHFLKNNPHDYERNLLMLLCSFSLYHSLQPQKTSSLPQKKPTNSSG